MVKYILYAHTTNVSASMTHIAIYLQNILLKGIYVYIYIMTQSIHSSILVELTQSHLITHTTKR